MKTIVEINSTNFGSTGSIMLQIADKARSKGFKVVTCYPKSRSNICNMNISDSEFIGNRISRNIHLRMAEYTGYNGCYSIISTLFFLRKIDRIKPDLLHLHNLHNCYINLPLLFNYIKKHNIQVIWTLHDCWSFTGQCPYFELVNCNKWKTGCHDCPQFDAYPDSKVDQTRKMWKLKKKWFTGINDMVIVTPSQWLAGLVRQSYLKDYRLRVINNGVDLDIFKPTESSFRDRYNINNKYIILGVAFGWGKRKGLDVFIELSTRLDELYKIVLVGTSDEIDKNLPEGILSIHRTNNQHELAEIYSAADLFVNPTREEVFGLVNIEAIACGTPVLTFNTGGSPECIDKTSGVVVECDDIDSMEREIINICITKKFSMENCINRAKLFDKKEKYDDYVRLYEEVLSL